MTGLIIDSLSMRFDLPGGKSVQALQDINLTIQKGELVSVLGPSGCGKTTLLNILAGFLAPTSGKVTLNGHAVTGPHPDHFPVFLRVRLPPMPLVAPHWLVSRCWI